MGAAAVSFYALALVSVFYFIVLYILGKFHAGEEYWRGWFAALDFERNKTKENGDE